MRNGRARARARGTGTFTCTVTFTAAILALLWPGAATAQEPSPAPLPAGQRELAAVQELLARATAEFDGPQQSRSIVLFDEIVSRLESLRRQGLLNPRGRDILASAYELRARAYYNIGLQEKAAESFRALVQFQPQYTISRERVSPKVVDYFESVKKALVGYLAVTTRPAGARVSLNGEFLALSDFFPMEVLAGEYTVEIAREGYQTETRALSLAPQATETLTSDLVRTMASAFYVTEPPGVEVWVDGQLRATTAGSPPPAVADALRAAGFDPSRASAPLEVGGLAVGTHVVEFRRKCYETVRRTVEVTEPRDYDQDPVRLQESVAALRLRSDPAGARIYVDGEDMGVTPRDLERVCSGRHRIEVKHAAGKFVQDLTLERGESRTLDCPIRPTLAFVGVIAESTGAERVVAEAEERIAQNLAAVKSLNFLPAPRDTVEHILAAEQLTRRGLVPGRGSDPDVIRKATEKLAAALEVQGFLIAVLPEEQLHRTAVLHLLAAGNTVADQWSVNFGESASYLRFLAALDRTQSVYRPWTGLITVDTLLHEGVPVLRVVAGGPAAAAGTQPGDVLESLDGRPLRQTVDLLAAVAARAPGDKLALRLKGAAGARTVELKLGETPEEVPLNEAGLLYNKVMMDLRQKVEGYPGTESAAFARLNLALCAMHFADFAAAHEHLLKARAELPQRAGLSQGTALYYLAVALERLGYAREAAEAYRAAAAERDATLFDNDGPSVAALASRRGGM